MPGPLARVEAWLGPPRDYRLTRWLIVRLLGVVYVFAFLGIVQQGLPLLGEHGLTPVTPYLERWREAGEGFWQVPSVLFGGSSDGAIVAWAWIGLVLSACVVIGYANLPMLLALWFIYGSFVRVGQLWFAFGWEIQILETTVVAALLVHPWDPRPLRAPAPPTAAIVLRTSRPSRSRTRCRPGSITCRTRCRPWAWRSTTSPSSCCRSVCSARAGSGWSPASAWPRSSSS